MFILINRPKMKLQGSFENCLEFAFIFALSLLLILNISFTQTI